MMGRGQPLLLQGGDARRPLRARMERGTPQTPGLAWTQSRGRASRGRGVLGRKGVGAGRAYPSVNRQSWGGRLW